MWRVKGLFHSRPQDTIRFNCVSAPATHGLGAFLPNKTGTSALPIYFNMLEILQRFNSAFFDVKVTLSIIAANKPN